MQLMETECRATKYCSTTFLWLCDYNRRDRKKSISTIFMRFLRWSHNLYIIRNVQSQDRTTQPSCDPYNGLAIFTILTMVARPSCNLINGFYWKQAVTRLSIIARRSHNVFNYWKPSFKHKRVVTKT